MQPSRSVVTHELGRGYIDRWNCVGDFVRYAQSIPRNSFHRTSSLGINFEEACRLAMEGDPTLAAKTREKLDYLSEHLVAERTEWKTTRSVAGTKVNVGEYLSGSPTCMRTRKRVNREVRFVNIYLAIATNSSVRHEQVLNRGVYILAFLEALQKLRISCDLYLMSDTGESGYGIRRKDSWQVIKVDSNPLDLSVSGFAIAHPAFSTVLTFATAAELIRFEGQAPHAWRTQSWDNYNEKFMPEILEMGPEDVYIRELRYGDPFINDPDKWLRDALSKFATEV